MRDPRLVIFTDDPGWHGRVLIEAFAARGRDSVFVSLTECHLDLGAGGATVRIPDFGGALPAGVFVRGVPGGTLEQVILRLDILHALQAMGVAVYNDGRAIERTVDKAMTSLLLRRAGLPTPDTWICESAATARAVVEAQTGDGRVLVAKPLFGSQGKGLRLIRGVADLERNEGLNGVYYLQTFIARTDAQWSDIRVFVIAGRARAAMRRHSDHWITNRAQGGRCEALRPDAGLVALAEAAARAVDIDYAGVDLMPLPGGGLTVTEVNSVPAWYGLQSVADIDIAAALADHFFAKIAETAP
jgi:RimK family alpha-L-glutamate ligase